MTEVAAFTTSVAVLHPHEPKILCVRHPQFGLWMFPGGHVDPGEAPHSTAVREIEEEVGLAVRLLDMSPLPMWSDGRNGRLPQPLAIIEERLEDGRCFVDFVYMGLADRAELRFDNEIETASWFDTARLRDLPTAYPIRDMAAYVLGCSLELRRKAVALGTD